MSKNITNTARLIIDIGNSRLKWACWQAGDALNTPMITAMHAELNTTLFSHWWNTLNPQSVTIVSVANISLVQQLAQWWQQRGVSVCCVKSSAQACGVRNAYAEPTRLGVDRWAALIAAHHIIKSHVLIVDAGTALTLDVLRNDGEHLGGYIVPGIHMMRAALAQGTAALPDAQGTGLTLGKNTNAAIAHGTLNSAIALIERTWQQTEQQLASTLSCVLTGGDAQLLRTGLTRDCVIMPALTLLGAAQLTEANLCEAYS
ncbi:MAG: type III pantothenate kinase [Gammaproteobacteria bacterium]|nr:type III pantothenate kinase [Gammaproteobacteria bacterium]